MVDLRAMLQRWSPAQQREVLYYLVRYFKQSHFLEDRGKDIFDDVFDRSPSEHVRDTTLQAISAIESSTGKKATEFADDDADSVLNLLTDIENEIEDDFTKDELARASDFLRKIG